MPGEARSEVGWSFDEIGDRASSEFGPSIPDSDRNGDRADPEFRVDVRYDGARAQVALFGELDRETAAHLQDSLAFLVRHMACRLIQLDLGRLASIDVHACQELIRIGSRCLEAGTRLVVRTAPPTIHRGGLSESGHGGGESDQAGAEPWPGMTAAGSNGMTGPGRYTGPAGTMGPAEQLRAERGPLSPLSGRLPAALPDEGSFRWSRWPTPRSSSDI